MNWKSRNRRWLTKLGYAVTNVTIPDDKLYILRLLIDQEIFTIRYVIAKIYKVHKNLDLSFIKPEENLYVKFMCGEEVPIETFELDELDDSDLTDLYGHITKCWICFKKARGYKL